MTALAMALLDKAKLWLALAGAFVLAVGVALLKGYSAGRQAQKAAQAKAVEKSRQRVQANRVEAGVATEEDLDKALEKWAQEADQWSRD